MIGARRKATALLLLCGLVPLGASPVDAHHTGAMFDRSTRLSIAGTVRTLEWSNPHIWLWVVVPGDEAEALYAFEGASVGEMMRRNGWLKNSVRPGDKVTVDYAPFRDGKNGGLLLHVKLANGVILGAAE